MLRYIGWRLMAGLPVVAVVLVLSFGLLYLAPGDPAQAILGPDATAEQVARLHAALGLDRPFIEQFLAWSGGLLQGDLGDSLFLHQSVWEAILSHAQPTVLLAMLAQAIAILIGLTAGIFAALHRGRALDRVLMTLSIMGTAIPNFVLALGLVVVFAVGLGILPATGFVPLEAGLVQSLLTLVLPALALGSAQAALIARMMRSSMIEIMESDFILAARSIGVSRRPLILRYALGNTAGPTLSVIGVTFGSLLSGAVIVEMVFNIPGLGRLTIDAVQNRDVPVLQGVLLVTTMAYVVVTIIVDVLQAAINPRLRAS
ncbi:ABC transporter permease [Actinophytocola sp.]|uniref:ABC transporter permease n=1 Tax=Actinophytocola sp. TaxID=1872138 RepID=UPI003D6C55B4